MSVYDKLTERAMKGRETIDYPAVLTRMLGPDDTFKTYILASPSAAKRNSSIITLSPGRYVMFKLRKLGLEKLAERKHIGGAKDSMARQLPRDGMYDAIALSANGLSIWKFSNDPNDTPVCRATLPRPTIASFVATGATARSGGTILRLTFTDGSFFDYAAASWSSPGDITWLERDFPQSAATV